MGLYDKYVVVEGDSEKIDHQLLFSDMAELRGFRSTERQRALYDRVHEWFNMRDKVEKDEVPF